MPTGNNLLIRCGTLIDGTGAEPLYDVTLLVRDGHIAEITRGNPTHAGFVEIDAGRKSVMPGLIDAHVHLVFNPLTTHDEVIADYLAADDRSLCLRALRNAQAALAAGVTTLRDCGDRDFISLSVKRAIEQGLLLGPRILVCGPPITTTAGHCHFLGGQADTRAELVKAVRGRVARGADFIKVMATGGNMTPGSNNRAAQYTETELRLIVEESHRLGKRVAAHTLATDGIRSAVASGVDTLEHCTWLASSEADGLEYDAACVSEMARQGLYWSNTITGLMRALITQESLAVPRSLLDQWFALFQRMIDAGVRMLISSDAGVRNTRFEDFSLGLEVAIQHMALSPLDAIVAATRTPAAALGIDDVTGTLVPGKSADLLILSENPIAHPTTLRRPELVIKGGTVVAERGRLVTPPGA